MNYLNLLKDLTQDGFRVTLDSMGDKTPYWLAMADKVGGDDVHARAATPEEAIRQLYLLLNPIPKNVYTGLLRET